MGEVDQAQNGKDHRQPDGNQRVDAAEAERVDQLLPELSPAQRVRPFESVSW